MPHVVVVGAGVSGLATAMRLRDRAPTLEVSVLEASERIGGLVRTECFDEWVVERGPESILTDKPATLRVVDQLGIEANVVRTEPGHRGAFLVVDGRLERIPEGFQLLAPTDVGAWMRTEYVSLPGRIRALLDLVMPGDPREDETLGSFVRRRFGQEVLDRLAQPLVGGIYGAHPDVLGLAATMPRFLEAERTHGSVIRALRERAKEAPAQGARYGLFINFDRGMQTLTDAMGRSVSDSIRLRTQVSGVERSERGFRLALAEGTVLLVEGLVIAIGGAATARMVSALDAELGASIASIRHGSGAIVTLAFERAQIDHPLDAYGYVTPSIEGRRVLASTWLSRKWPGRAPADKELMRFFFGRDGDDDVVGLPDDALVALARAEAAELVRARGEPLFFRVDRWRDAMPRFGLHHLERVRRIEERVSAIPGLEVAGNAYHGVGIPDSIVSGERAAERVLAQLGA